VDIVLSPQFGGDGSYLFAYQYPYSENPLAAQGGAPGSGKAVKSRALSRKYSVTKNGKTMVFRDPRLAEQMLHSDDEPAPAPKRKKKATKIVTSGVGLIELPAIGPTIDHAELRRQATLQAAAAERKRALERAHYAALLSQLRRKQIEEEDHFLLSASA
jgi:hypothetical protein